MTRDSCDLVIEVTQMTETIDISAIAYGGYMQPRAAVDEQVVRDYAEQMQAGATFPPIVVFSINGAGCYDLADGGHRIRAALHIGATTIDAEVNTRDPARCPLVWPGGEQGEREPAHEEGQETRDRTCAEDVGRGRRKEPGANCRPDRVLSTTGVSGEVQIAGYKQ